jgi:glycogen operon protein
MNAMSGQRDLPWPGKWAPLGATFDRARGGTNVALWSRGAEAVELCLLDEVGAEVDRVPLVDVDHGVWHGFLPGMGPGCRYGYRVHGRWDPAHGARFNPAKLLLDPYARAVTGTYRLHEAVFGHVHGGSDLVRDDRDSAPHVPHAVVVEGGYDWSGDVRPDTPWADTVIYELHVKGFTAAHPGVPKELRGTYAGLAHPASVEYLTDLGVTALELLPVHQFVSEEHLLAGGRQNYWGYNTLGYFAPHGAYAATGTTGEQVREFQDMVRALHAAGLEVILDVVYNHTAEGAETGPTLSLRGIDNAAYYRLREGRRYVDYTGCGNTLDLRAPQALALVTDSLRYWVTEMGVDGFRFDLATALIRGERDVDPFAGLLTVLGQDPVLSRVKLIAEPWDLGDGGYRLGGFPPPWAEWNDKYRGTLRDFWRGAAPGVNDLAYRLSGSSDLFAGRGPTASIDFVTAHDGFTLRDLVSYQHKHNEANGEHNRDGTDDNRSWNCGVEGETDNRAIASLRERQIRNLLTTLMLSIGVPMLVAGDERGRTQRGNNNAYCQDNEISWVDWGPDPVAERLVGFTRNLLALRRAHPVFRQRQFFTGRPGEPGARPDVGWFTATGEELAHHDWLDPGLRTLGMYVSGDATSRRGERGEVIRDDSFLLLLHAGHTPIEFRLPGKPWADVYRIVLDTDVAGGPEPVRRPYRAGQTVPMHGRSAVLLHAGPRRPRTT